MANSRETKRVCLFQRRQQKSAKPYAAKSAKRCTGAPLAALIPTNRHRYQVCSATSLRQLITTGVLQASPRFLSCILDTCQPCGGMKCMKLNESMAGTLPCAHLRCKPSRQPCDFCEHATKMAIHVSKNNGKLMALHVLNLIQCKTVPRTWLT